MKMIVAVALALVAVASALPVEERPADEIVTQQNKQDENGYQFGFETKNGLTREEKGTYEEYLDEENKPQKVVNVRGSYGYVDNDGNIEIIKYFADKFGFHAEGPSIPKVSSR